jgi:hypothetical protein
LWCSVCDRLEAEIETNLKKAEALHQRIIVLVSETLQAKEAISAGQSTPMDYDQFFP